MTEQKMLGVIELKLPEGKRLLSGKEVGVHARQEFGLDLYDDQVGYVEVKILAPVVTSSFILGMFSKSVKKLGLDQFFEKYRFDAKDEIIKNIEQNARYSLTEGTALS